MISLVLLLGKGAPAWHTWEHDSRASAEEVLADAARADRLQASSSTIRDSLRARSGRVLALAPLVVEGDTPAAAAATLASFVSEAASDAGVKLGALQPRVLANSTASTPTHRPSAEHLFVRISVHADLTGDVIGIAQLLGDVERGPALLSVNDLTISQPEPQAPSARMEILHAELTVVGLALAASNDTKKSGATGQRVLAVAGIGR